MKKIQQLNLKLFKFILLKKTLQICCCLATEILVCDLMNTLEVFPLDILKN